MRHKIEETVKVYLLWDEQAGEWVIDPITFYGPLDGSTDGVCINCGDADDHPDSNDECEAEATRAGMVDLPTAEQLFRMLADELGYTLTVTRQEG